MNLDIDIDLDIDFETDDKLKDTFIKIENQKVETIDVVYKNAVELAKNIKIQRNDLIYCFLHGRFIFGDFIGAFIQQYNLNVLELTITTLSGSFDNFDMIFALVKKGWVKKCNIILSEYFLWTEKRKNTKTIELLENNKNENIKIYYTNTHAKIVLIKTEHEGKNGFVTISGSANLRSSQNIEQLIIQENEKTYEFNYKFLKSIIELG